MSWKCQHCAQTNEDTAVLCSSCGSEPSREEPLLTETLSQGTCEVIDWENGLPTTLEDLQEWVTFHNLPPEETTRFFIGKNLTEARLFGIYRDGEKVVVYKNKSDGSRFIRYQGSDEAFAVREFLTRLRQEIQAQKSRSGNRKKAFPLLSILFSLLTAFGIAVTLLETPAGYYRYEDQLYYYSHSTWYISLGENSWSKAGTVPGELAKNHQKYFCSEGYQSTYGACDFLLSTYYFSEVADTWESSDQWDVSDLWDATFTDWDSDWSGLRQGIYAKNNRPEILRPIAFSNSPYSFSPAASITLRRPATLSTGRENITV